MSLRDNSDLPDNQPFLKANIPIPWLCFLFQCSYGIFQHVPLKQSPGCENHPDSVRYLYWIFEDESNERKNNCLLLRLQGVWNPHPPVFMVHFFSLFKMKLILLIHGRGCCSHEQKPPFHCCIKSKEIITVNNTKVLKENRFIRILR